MEAHIPVLWKFKPAIIYDKPTGSQQFGSILFANTAFMSHLINSLQMVFEGVKVKN